MPRFTVCLHCIVLLLLQQTLSAQYLQWGNLTPGPYAVGYKTIMITDSSRTYQDAQPPFASNNGPKQYRKIPLYIWYPASINANSKTMVYGDYLPDLRNENPAQAPGEDLAVTIPAQLKRGFQISDSAFNKAIKVSIPVYKNARPIKQAFPVVLHSHAIGLLFQTILMEYLASNGYVVVSYPRLGSAPLYYGWTEDNLMGEMVNADDVGAVFNSLNKIAGNANTANVSFVGNLSEKAINYQFKQPCLTAIAVLGGSVDDRIKANPYYNAKNFRIPVLYTPASANNSNPSFIDSLLYAPRWIVKFKEMAHTDFYPFDKIFDYANSRKYVNYEYLAKLTLEFLNAVQKNKTGTITFTSVPADVLAAIEVHDDIHPLPTETEFLAWLKTGEAQKAWQYYNANKSEPLVRCQLIRELLSQLVDANKLYVADAVKMYLKMYPADEMQSWLIGMLVPRCENEEMAKTVFSAVLEIKPGSPYAYNGLSDFYEKVHNKTNAIQFATQALQLAKTATALNADERTELIRNIQEKLSRLNK
jgi:hypothetical protein